MLYGEILYPQKIPLSSCALRLFPTLALIFTISSFPLPCFFLFKQTDGEKLISHELSIIIVNQSQITEPALR